MKHVSQLAAISAAILLSASIAHADFATDFNKARAMFYKGKADQALVLMIDIGKTAETQLQKSEALSMASTIALRLKNPDQAMELARQIPISEQSLNAQADVLTYQRNRQGIVDLYANQDFTAWPAKDAAEAYTNLGNAQYQLKQGHEALASLEKAAELDPTSRYLPNILMSIGNTWLTLLGDNTKAMEAYHEVYDSTNNVARHSETALAIAKMYMNNNEPDKALAELNKIDMLQLTPTYGRVEILRAKAAIFTLQGDKAQALELYKQALEHHDIYAFQKKACEEAIKELKETAN